MLNFASLSWHHVPVAAIRRADVQSWVRDLSAVKGLAPRTVRECYRILSGVMSEAVEERLVAESPSRRVKLPRVESVERRFLTPEQVEELADAAHDVLRPMIYVGAYMGLRWSEAAGLKREYLHLFPPRSAHAVIAGTLERDGGRHRYVEETKSAAGRRRVPVPAFLVDELAAHLARAPESDFVFCGRDGGHLHYWNVLKRRWHPAVERAGLAPLRFHDLRHTAATIMIDEGADVLAVSRRLGHQDVAMTLNLCGHRFPQRDDELTARLDECRRRAVTGAAPVARGLLVLADELHSDHVPVAWTRRRAYD